MTNLQVSVLMLLLPTATAAFAPPHYNGRLSLELASPSPPPKTTTTAFIPRKAVYLYATETDDDDSNKSKEPSDDSTTSSDEKMAFETPSLGNIPASLDEPSSKQRQSQKQQLDPLIVSLTRMDEATQAAPTMQVPVWGELILDRSLFVLLPVALFALGGLLLSIQVAVNSVDAIVDAASVVSANSASSASIPDPNACRGLCSDQEQNYYGLQTFMNKLAGK